MTTERGEDDSLGSEAIAQASRSGRGRKLATASCCFALLSSPLLLWWGLPAILAMNAFYHEGSLSRGMLLFLLMGYCMVISAPAAVVAGHFAIAKSRPGRMPKRAIFGVALGYLNIVVPLALVTFTYYHKWRPNADMAICANNLKQIGIALKMYRDENKGMFPVLPSRAGELMFSPNTLFSDVIRIGPTLFTCPTIRYAKKRAEKPSAVGGRPALYSDQNYFYLGYAVFNDDDVEAFAKAYRKQIAEGGTFDKDLVVEDANGTRVLRRLSDRLLAELFAKRERRSPPVDEEHGMVQCYVMTSRGVAPDFLPPVIIERDLLAHEYTEWGPPRPVGAHVLFADEGVFFIDRGAWPMTEKTQRILAELAGD